MSKRALAHLRTDPILAEIIEKVGSIPLRARRHTPFRSLTQAIVHQQLSGKAAETILGRFQGLYLHPEDAEFPRPHLVAATSVEQLRSAGLSRPKAGYIVDLATRAHAGVIPTLEECDDLEDEEIIARLTEIKGIGRWTVEMLLIFNLGRPDVLPVHDLGVRRGFQVAYGKRAMPSPEHLGRFGKRWAPYRSLAARYLWRAADSDFKK